MSEKKIEEVVLEPRLVGNIEGDFYVPAYQRGYRWKEEVNILLKDIEGIDNNTKNYCLQPIVVKKIGDKRYELIDGQQRLTTLYLLFRVLSELKIPLSQKFSIEYETRENSKTFLESMNKEMLILCPENEPHDIDEYYLLESYRTISNWFNPKKEKVISNEKLNLAWEMFNKLNKQISVIWYEVQSNEGSEDLFTRLNVGRIPLTNSELVKALFLSKYSTDSVNGKFDEDKQIEIAMEWDRIEKELHNEEFWSFLTNEKSDKYPTRIDLLLDMVSSERTNKKDAYSIFLFFNEEMKKSEQNEKTWENINKYFLLLKEWYENRNLYHKVGYLIATGEDILTLINHFRQTKMKKSSLEEYLDGKIAEKIILADKEFSDLSYTDDYEFIKKLLLLFNVETTRQINDDSIRFSFNKHKTQVWSLEHIHAQHSDKLNKLEQWKEWLNLHQKSLETIKNVYPARSGGITSIIAEITEKNTDKLTGEIFQELSNRVIAFFVKDGDTDAYKDALENMALLDKDQNSALNSSAFDVKRDKIIGIDKLGEYIPICTRRVFLKYYTPAEYNQLNFWGKEDRKFYLKAMSDTLEHYLSINKQEIK